MLSFFDLLQGRENMDESLLQAIAEDDLYHRLSPEKTYPVLIHCPKTRSRSSYFSRLGIQDLFPYAYLDAYFGRVNCRQLNILSQNPHISYISLNRQVKILLDVTGSAVLSRPVRENYGYTGKGVTVAVIDTGISPHPDLSSKGKVLAFQDFIKGTKTPYDDHGHGTHVAGIVSGSGSLDPNYKGIAPDSSLVILKALDRKGRSSESLTLTALEWLIRNQKKYQIRVLSLSIGTSGIKNQNRDLIVRAVNKLWDMGVVVFAACGNDGPKQRTIASPAVSPKIIGVGAADHKKTYVRTDDTVADFSSRGPTIQGYPKPDLVAPGTDIVSLKAVPSSKKGEQPHDLAAHVKTQDSYTSKTGTSMAAPVCAGVAALLLEKDPGLTPDEIKKILIHTAYPIPDPVYSTEIGMIDAEKAIQAVKPGPFSF